MCDHDFQLGAEGEVRCINCFVGDDEMEASVYKKLDGAPVAIATMIAKDFKPE